MQTPNLIDRIVNGVLKQLAGETAAPMIAESQSTAHSKVVTSAAPATQLVVAGKVITAEVLADCVAGQPIVVVSAKAIVTPAALDYLKERRLTLVREGEIATSAVPSATHSTLAASPSLLIVVKHTEALARIWDELKSSWKRELTGCPDDAAKLAIAELSRGGVSQVVILAEQTFRAACLANRSDKVKAVPVASVSDIRAAGKQIRVNTWCLDPAHKTGFELRTLFKNLNPKS